MASFVFVRLEFSEKSAIGPHRAAILQGIDELGSISATARAIGLTYRQTWSNIKVINEMFPHPSIEVRQRGSTGGATLTPFGKEVLKRFRAMERDARRAVAKHVKPFQLLMEVAPTAPIPFPRGVSLPTDGRPPDGNVNRRAPTARPKKPREPVIRADRKPR